MDLKKTPPAFKKQRVKKLFGGYQLILFDAINISAIYALSILFLGWNHVEGFDVHQAFIILPFVVVLKIFIYIWLRLYRMVTDNVGIDESFRISVGVVISNITIAVITLSIRATIHDFAFIPEEFLIFLTFAEVIVLLIPRVTKRVFKYLSQLRVPKQGKRTLLVGAGDGGRWVLNQIRNTPELSNQVIAFVDDNPEKINKLVSGYEVFGPIEDIPDLIDFLRIEEVIITIANLSNERFQEIVEIIAQKPVRIKRIPKMKDIKKEAPKKLLEVNVEDLLSRDVIALNDQGIHDFITGKRVLVTGAGGSIGSELVRQIVSYQPSQILLVDIYENGVYDLQMELNLKKRNHPKDFITEYKVLIASVYNYDRMNKIFSDFQPELVFHAAAYKHVPLMEDSAVEAVRTNVLGTYNVSKLCSVYGVKKMVLVSSDKAVRPTNVMGATKRFAEMTIQYFNSVSETSYSAVRFGNVLGSNGSVVPLFKRQIESGGPVTVTDKNIIRYFMTIPEAVGLILQSSTFAKGGEIFILDMGEPVKIYDLAEKMIMLSGLRPHKDIEIKITGLRPGEKLYEELLVDVSKNNIKTENKKIFIEANGSVHPIEEEIREITKIFESLQNTEIKEMVQSHVSTYTIKK